MQNGLLPGESGVKFLLRVNQEHSRMFCDPGISIERRRYRSQHPTEIGVMKCMDGRLHFPVITETALGIIQPWRNLGGKFDLGWIGYQKTVEEWVRYAIGMGRCCLPITTYHFSKGDRHRGCRGFNHDSSAAYEAAFKLKCQFGRVFGDRDVYAICCGIETDEESLVLHSHTGCVSVSSIANDPAEDLSLMLRKFYPDMPLQILRDLVPLVEGNVQHVRNVRALNRPIVETEHKEWILAVGRGFDWLHLINKALIVGPFDPNLDNAIETAARLLWDNLQHGRIEKSGGIVLISSAPYRDKASFERRLAEEKARFLERFSVQIIEERVPELLPYLSRVVTTVDFNTRELDLIGSC